MRPIPKPHTPNPNCGDQKILIAGFGGQGIMFLGKILSQAAMLEGKNVTYIRSYGAEMRGGTAHCMVKMSKTDIASPIFEQASTAVLMNQPSLDRFLGKIEKTALLVLNNSLIEKRPKAKGLKIKGRRFNELALALGSVRVANIICLGFLLAQKPLVRISSVRSSLKDIFKNKPDLLRINLQALDKGYKDD